MTAVAVSSCGNYGLVGTAAGRVDRYNMQSGLHRFFYARWVTPARQGSRTGCAMSGPQDSHTARSRAAVYLAPPATACAKCLATAVLKGGALH